MIERLRALFSVTEDGQLVRRINWYKGKAGEVAGGPGPAGYLRCRVDGKYMLVHRIIFAMHYGYLPDSVDHKDGNILNNRPANLRAATQSQQLCNTKKRESSRHGVKGLDKSKNNWRGRVCVSGVVHSFEHKDRVVVEAWLNRTRQELHGEFACNGR